MSPIVVRFTDSIASVTAFIKYALNYLENVCRNYENDFNVYENDFMIHL